MQNITQIPSLYLGFASLHLLLGQFFTQFIYQLRFRRSALAIYQAEPNRHNRISRWILVIASGWYLSLALYAFSPYYRDSFWGSCRYPLDPQWGWIIALSSMILMLLSQYLMGESFRIGQAEVSNPAQQPLQTQGLYQWSRNPIYVFSFLTLFGISLWSLNVLTFGLLLLIGFLINHLVIEEEQYLALLHGQSYQRYRNKVGRYLPRFKPFRGV